MREKKITALETDLLGGKKTWENNLPYATGLV